MAEQRLRSMDEIWYGRVNGPVEGRIWLYVEVVVVKGCGACGENGDGVRNRR